MSKINLQKFIISRRRKRYKFALFSSFANCYELDEIKTDLLNQAQIMEIGAGTADLSLALAKQSPNKSIIAVDVKGDRLQSGAKQALDLKLNNLKFVRAYVKQLDQKMTNPNLEQLWITFCDPYPKERAAKHRLTHPDYLALYQRWLSPTGKLYFKTDNLKLFDYSVEQLEQNNWKIIELSRDLHHSDLDQIYKQTTKYERRYLAENKPIYFLIAEFDKGA